MKQDDNHGRRSRTLGDRRIDPDSSIELLRQARAGDQDALERLCRRYIPRLTRWASGRLPRWTRDLLDTDDLVQESVLGTIRRLPEFEPRGDGALQSYLRQAVLNRIAKEIRAVRRRPFRAELSGGQADPEPSALEEAMGRELLERYENALQRLKEADREAIIAKIELGCGYAELAQALGSPSTDAARMAVSRALVRLAREMSDER